MEKGTISKGVFSLEESLESLASLNSLEALSLGNGRILLCFPQSWGSLESLDSRTLENGFLLKRPLFPKPNDCREGKEKPHQKKQKKKLSRESAKSCFCNRALVKTIFEALECLYIKCFRGPKIGLD